jgi:hypothetical protein
MRALIIVLAVSTIGCGLTGPSESLTGRWVANSGDHFTFAELNLQQTGDEITGTACENAAGRVLFSGVPVTGDYPNLQFTFDAANQFRGRQDSSKDIVGTYRGHDIRFKRSDEDICR